MATKQVTVYVDEESWQALRVLGMASGASASAQCVVLVHDYLAANDRRHRDVLRRAAELSRGNSSRARLD